MRRTAFGDPVIESTEDDLGLLDDLQDAGEDIYATVSEDAGKFYFEVMHNDDGEGIVSSDPIFDTKEAARDYLQPLVSDVQFNV